LNPGKKKKEKGEGGVGPRGEQAHYEFKKKKNPIVPDWDPKTGGGVSGSGVK